MQFISISKKILLCLLFSLPCYTHAQAETEQIVTHHVEKKTSKKRNSGFLWKFSTGFVTGIATMHILQKTLLKDGGISKKLCIYTQLRNLLTK